MKYIIVIAFLLYSSVSLAGSFSWTYEESDQSNIEGFRIYEITGKDARVTIADNIPPASRSITDVDTSVTDECRTFYIVATKGTKESPASNTASTCPKHVIPPRDSLPIPIRGTFSGTFELQ